MVRKFDWELRRGEEEQITAWAEGQLARGRSKSDVISDIMGEYDISERMADTIVENAEYYLGDKSNSMLSKLGLKR